MRRKIVEHVTSHRIVRSGVLECGHTVILEIGDTCGSTVVFKKKIKKTTNCCHCKREARAKQMLEHVILGAHKGGTWSSEFPYDRVLSFLKSFPQKQC